MENQMNETMQPEEKLTRKERKQRWKAAQKARKAEKREYYRYAPALKRWWALYLWKPFVAILALAVLIPTLYKPIGNFVSNVVVLQALEARNRPLSEEDIPKIYELAPLDEDGAARVAAYPAVGGDETWTLCVYLVASDLEDQNENDLSYVTSMLTREVRSENGARKRERRLSAFYVPALLDICRKAVL
jgi:hypothetical protein